MITVIRFMIIYKLSLSNNFFYYHENKLLDSYKKICMGCP